jgi:glycosyltransferase involved in cell wall biosynthesis
MSEKLKIGFVCADDANDVRSWSGIPYHLLNALKRQDILIELFSPLKRDFRYLLAPLKIAARLSNRDIELDRFPYALRSYARQVKKHMDRSPVDVILSTSTYPITFLECTQPIVCYTDALFHLMPGYYGGSFARLTPGAIRRGKWQDASAFERCTIGASASNWAAEGCRKLTRPDKIRVVPFGANMPVDHDMGTVQKWISERLNRKPSVCQLLFCGVDWVRKGGKIAVDTARLLNEMGINTRLTIIGCKPVDEFPEYVEVLGFIDKQSSGGRKQLAELYRSATLFILPTQAEAAGIVFCEASAFGVPSITFKTGGVEDYVVDGINGVCLPLGSNPEIFAERIKAIVNDRQQYSALCLGGFREFKTRLNWDRAACALVDLCREAIGS